MEVKVMICKMVAIDASTNKTAMSLFVNGIYESRILIDLSDMENNEERFRCMGKAILDYLNQTDPYIIYVEDTAVLTNAKTQRALTRLQGIIYSFCLFHDCEFNAIKPTEWRSLVGIKQGNKKREALKTVAVDYVKELLGIEVTDDEAESILIGIAAMAKFNGLDDAIKINQKK